MSKVDFVQKVKDLLKASDDTKISRFHKKTLKHLNDQIKIRQDSIDELNEKIIDLEEEYEEAVYNIDLDRIKSTEETKNYSEEYVDKLFSYELKISNLKDDIETKKEEIDFHKRAIAKIK